MQRPFFHFQNSGYQRNPFGALTDAEWSAIAVLPPVIVGVLDAGFAHLQVLGPMGIGKSTTLLALQAWFVAQKAREHEQSVSSNVVYEYLPEGQKYFVTHLSDVDLFLLDEAQRLNWWQRRRLMKGAKEMSLPLVLSSHEDLTPLFAKWGLRLTSVDLTGEMDVGWITAVIHKRLATFAIPNQPHATLTDDAIRYLAETFGQNLRQMEYFLYEVWQQLTDTEPVDVPFLQAVKNR